MRWERQYKEKWTESVPAPLELTDTQVLDWMEDVSSWAIWSKGKWHVTPEGFKTVSNRSLREAVCQAAAYMEAE